MKPKVIEAINTTRAIAPIRPKIRRPHRRRDGGAGGPP